MGRNLNNLHPYVKGLAENLIYQCKNQGIQIIITSTLRTFKEQADLYALGRSRPGKIVTNAKPGYSYHNYGLAFDVCPLVNGNTAWDRIDLFDKIGQIGKKIGLQWGGNFKSIIDKPHFQATGGCSIKDLISGKIPVFPKEEDFILAVNTLEEKGMIKSPNYWLDAIVYKSEYVREMIGNFAQFYSKMQNSENKFEDALKELKEKGVIDTPDYWRNTGKYNPEYVKILIKKIANYLNTQEKKNEFMKGINKLVEKEIIHSPDYWIENAVMGKQVHGEYVEILIKRIGTLLE